MLAGHCYKHLEEAATNLVVCTPYHGNRGWGRPWRTFVYQVRDDTGFKEHEMASLLMSRDQWRILKGRGYNLDLSGSGRLVGSPTDGYTYSILFYRNTLFPSVPYISSHDDSFWWVFRNPPEVVTWYNMVHVYILFNMVHVYIKVCKSSFYNTDIRIGRPIVD